VTDANLLTGRLNPLSFLGGKMPLDVERARAALAGLAGRVGVSVEDAAAGILRIANANMINAIKLISVQRGHDPRDFTLVAMGGAGPVHAAYLARELAIGRVLIPVAPGHFSAYGMLTTDVRRDYIRTLVMRTDQVAPSDIERAFAELEEMAMDEAAEDGFPARQVRLERSADMRYRGQEHTVHVLVPGGALDGAALQALEERFHNAHQRHYTFRLDSPIEIVNLHLVAFGRVPKPSSPRFESTNRRQVKPVFATRPVWFEDEGTCDAAVHQRAGLTPGVCLEGPAIIEESAATTVLYPGMTLTVDALGNLLIATGH
jgi:N-methylhydantoinase A